MEILLRPSVPEDREFILRLNRENVSVLAPLDEEKLKYFESVSDSLLIAEAGGVRAAFLIALTDGVQSYESENYRRFSREFPEFLYVDRIVIDAPFRRQKIGKRLYEHIFERARTLGKPVVTAEIDIKPFNAQSLAFHKSMGFTQIDTQIIRCGEVAVSLQKKDI